MQQPNYISEINMFYDWLETNQIPKSAIALWHGLMHIANKAGWEQSFTVAISTIESKTGFKRSELFEARNILTQKGRINWKQRGGNLCAEYELNFFCVHNTDAKAYTKGYTVPDAKAYTNPTQKHTINKTKLKETKLDHNSFSVPPSAATGGKRKNESFPHLKILVENWFSFYKEKFQQEPSFTGPMAASLKSIADRLKKFSSEKGFEWTEEYSAKVFKHFLTKAYADEWLRNNFLLTNLSTKFDSIINSSIDGTTKTAKQPTGGAVNTASAFSKIDKLVSASGGA